MTTKQIQELSHSIAALQDKLDNHDCKYEDGCPCADWLFRKYSERVALETGQLNTKMFQFGRELARKEAEKNKMKNTESITSSGVYEYIL